MLKRGFMVTVLALLGVLLWLLLVWQPDPGHDMTVPLAEAPQGGDFTLNSKQGPVNLADFRGRVVLLYFGYTWCPDICPTNLSLFGSIMDSLDKDEQARVQPLFISVDPGRDSLDRLETYVNYFHPSLIGLTGTDAELTQVTHRYGAAYRIVRQAQETDYPVDHSADSYLIDTRGQLVRSYPHGTQAETLIAAIRELLRQP
ncbi:MAG: SCO family protein [Candidatus Thiodiazotropha sp.]